MPTIKRKVEMNLPQLIEWLFRKNNLDDEIFLSNQHNRVQVTDDGILEFFGTFYNDTFTVEIEEEITEDTVFELMIEITDSCPNCLWEEASVEDWKDEDSKEFHAYIDVKFKLILTK